MDFETNQRNRTVRLWKWVRWALVAVVLVLLVAGVNYLYQGPLGDILWTHLQKAQGE